MDRVGVLCAHLRVRSALTVSNSVFSADEYSRDHQANTPFIPFISNRFSWLIRGISIQYERESHAKTAHNCLYDL